jgi:hypothetical protein
MGKNHKDIKPKMAKLNVKKRVYIQLSLFPNIVPNSIHCIIYSHGWFSIFIAQKKESYS